MKLEDLFTYVRDIKPHAFTEEQTTAWLNELEMRVQQEILLLSPVETISYHWPEDKNTELLLDPPHDALYSHWLEAMVDYANGEYSKYQNTRQMFNAGWNALTAAFAAAYRPADGYAAHWARGMAHKKQFGKE